MDKAEIAFIERFLTQASIQKQWQYARSFVESYGERINEINQTYLINHVMRISADEPLYIEKHSSVPAMRARLLDLGVADSWCGCEMMIAGKMNFAMIKHHLHDSRTDADVTVIEKIFHQKNRGGFARETKLLANMPSNALKTPKFFGSHVDDPFYFEYAEFVGGSNPSPSVFERKFQRRALRHLWGCQPSQALLDAVPRKPGMLMDLTEVLDLVKTTQTADLEAKSGVSTRGLMDRLTGVFAGYEACPDTVFHDDLHRGNILADGEEFYILDWDKWKYEKPGAGAIWKGKSEADAVESFIKGAYPKDSPVAVSQFRDNYLTFNLAYALRKKDVDRAGLFAKMLTENAA